MPPKKADGTSVEDGAPALTAGDVKMIDVVLKNCSAAAKPTLANWDKIVSQLNLKDTKSAKERFRQVCKKYQWFEGSGNAEEGGASGATPFTPSPRVRKSASKRSALNLSSAGSGDEGSPLKKRKGNIKKDSKINKAKEEATNQGEEDEQDSIPSFVSGEI
ncbi:hypothetical protein F5B20DRAFT_535616 [Whalleya microplaca]|nr:hypothetical protein F5B20DRAFT_535616 [Whalleya microplaca]